MIAMFLKGFIYLFLAVLLSGCASIFTGTTTKINVSSDVSGTKIYYKDSKITKPILLGENSVSIGVKRKRLNTACFIAKKEGCKSSSQTLTSDFNYVFLVNILFPLGFIVDAATGAYRDVDGGTFVLNPVCK